MLLTNFYNKLPKSIKELVRALNDLDIKVGFIGGVTRDFILNGEISNDIDIEVRPKNSKKLSIKDLQSMFGGKLNKEFLILTLDIGDYSLEIGRPRIENYNDGVDSHKNFSFDFSNNYDKEFDRRDFTLNAIMFEFFKDQSKIIDPKNGIDDLKAGVLNPCSDDFKKDPVRLLRAYRFKISKGLSFSKKLIDLLQIMNVKSASSFYLVKEAFKSTKPLSFLKEVSIIKSFSENTVYNNNEFEISKIIGRDISILNRDDVLNELNLTRKYKLDCVDSSDPLVQYILFKSLLSNDFKEKEIHYILNYLGIKGINIKKISGLDFKINLKDVAKENREKVYMIKLLEEVSL